jgi:hypothetical protein
MLVMTMAMGMTTAMEGTDMTTAMAGTGTITDMADTTTTSTSMEK